MSELTDITMKKIDYELFAVKSGFKNANVARMAWSGVKKKLGLSQKSGDDKSGSPDELSGRRSGRSRH
jgi:hypothetical protein